MLIRNFVQVGLGLIKKIKYVGGIFIRFTDYFAAHPNQFAHDIFLHHDTCVLFNICATHNISGKTCYIITSADHFKFIVLAQIFAYGHKIYSRSFVEQSSDSGINTLISIGIKTFFCLNDFKHLG